MPSEKLEKGSKIVLKNLKIMEQNNSQAELVREGEREKTLKDVTKKEWVAVSVLFFVNLINYMDRFTLAGVLSDLQTYFKIEDDKCGLLQTVFVISYMVFAPLFGYLGDRYSRRWLMASGVILWSITTLCGSFMTDFWWFLLFRALVGIGEASYSTIAPTIISDLFVGNIRSKMLAIFYFAIPVGGGLGYIVGAETANAMGSWQWGLRVTPALGVVTAILMVTVLSEPERGASEGSSHMEATSWTEDYKDLFRNKSFMLSTAGFTCVAFVAGALAWWGPKFIELGIILQDGSANTDSVSLTFGVISMASGLIGVPVGSLMAQRMRNKYQRVDAYICAFGLLVSSPFVFCACFTAKYSTPLCFVFVFLGELFLNFTWSIVADILLYVVFPTRRSTAEGFQLLASHAFGDAGSPYLIGVLSNAYKALLYSNATSETSTVSSISTTVSYAVVASSNKALVEFKALEYALFTTCFVEVLGSVFFFLNAFYIVEDKEKVKRAVQGNSERLLINDDQQVS